MGSESLLATLTALVDRSPVPSWIADRQGGMLHVNQGFAELAGASVRELIGVYSVHRDPLVLGQGRLGQVLGALRDGAATQFVLRYDSALLGVPHDPPVRRTFRVVLTPMQEGGETAYALVQHFDLTEQVRLREELEASQERLELAIQGARDGVWDWDLRTDRVVYSDRWKEMLGYQPDELPDHLDTWSALTHPEDVEESWRRFHAYMVGETERFEMEFRARHRDGRWVPILSRAFKKLDKHGKPVRLVGTHMDLTELKEAEAEALREAQLVERILAHAADGMAIGSIGEDRHTVQVTLWNRRMEEITGLSRDAVTRVDPLTLAADQETRARMLRQLRDPQDVPVTEEWRVLHRDGRALHLSVSLSTLASGDFLLVARDLSRQRAEEAQRQEWDRRVQESQKLESLGLLAGGVAHDFNNILMAVGGNLQLAVMDLPADSPALPSLREAERAVARANELTQQMLAYSGRGHFVVRAVDLSEMVADVGSLLSSTLPAGVSLRMELGEGLSRVEADGTQLQQLVMNLIINGAEAYGGAEGEVVVRTSEEQVGAAALGALQRAEGLEWAVSPGRYAVLEVEDLGVGMTDEVRRRVFEPFFSTKFTGRGLGMAAVQGIVRGHRGGLALESALGEGTRWRVLLPALDR
ncbi:MAG: PAS domain S-box protein [Deltaproteobacteria bacterium]|nr:PAS domain S-box protein [Deltaproteobacteria bacterium]